MLEIGPFWLTVALLISETIKDMPNLFNNTCQKNQKESKDKSLSKSDLKYKYTQKTTQKPKIYYFTYNAFKHVIEIFIMSVHIMFQTLPT